VIVEPTQPFLSRFFEPSENIELENFEGAASSGSFSRNEPRGYVGRLRKEPSESTEYPVSNDHLTCAKLLALWPSSSMLRRLDDRIRELCTNAVKSQDPAELHANFSQLRAAMKEHIKRLRRSVVEFPKSQRRAG